jgi:C-terminal processing protease CtpA/Prc
MIRTAFLLIVLLALGNLAYPQNIPGDVDLDAYVQPHLNEVNKLWKEKAYEDALAILRGLHEIPGIDTTAYAWSSILYNMACAHSLLGAYDSAMFYLKGVVDAGYQNYDHLMKDSDLDPLRTDPEFAILAQRVKHASEFWDDPAIATKYSENISEDEKLAGLAKFWMEVKMNFVYFDHVPELDWDSLYVAYIPKVRRTGSTLEYYNTLREMCAQLRDGHTGINPPRELWPVVWASPDIFTKLIENKVIVTKVTSDSLKALPIKAGMEVLKIDGMDVKDYAARYVEPYMFASTPQGLTVQTYSYWLLSGAKDKPIALELADESGELVEVSVPRTTDFTRGPDVEYRELPGGIAYVSLNTFSNDGVFKTFDSLFATISKAKGLILDVRRNGGGNSTVGWNVLGCLTDSTFPALLTETINYSAHRRVEGRPQRYVREDWTAKANGKLLYTGPVVALGGPSTGSAAEDFLVAFRAMGRGKILGEPTYGSTGQPLTFKLAGGISGRVCTNRCFYPDGKPFEGIGVIPDIAVPLTIEDIRQDRDPVLDAAVKYLETQMK